MRALVFVAALVASHALAWQRGDAVELTTQDGEQVTGEVVTETQTGLLVRTGSGTRLFKFAAIAQISPRGVPAVAEPPPPERVLDQRIEARRRAEEEEQAREEAEASDPTLRRARWSLAFVALGGPSIENSASRDGVRCVPCVREELGGRWGGGLGLGLALPFNDQWSLRLGVTFDVNSGSAPSSSRILFFGSLLGELFFAASARLQFGLGLGAGAELDFTTASEDYRVPRFRPAFVMRATPFSFRLNAHHRLALQVSMLIIAGEDDAANSNDSLPDYVSTIGLSPGLRFEPPYSSATLTRVVFAPGLLYEIQF